MIESQLPNIEYYPISSGKLRRYLSVDNAKDVFKVLKGVIDARKVLKKDTLKYLPKDKADFVGATIRQDLKEGNQSRGYQLTGFDASKKYYSSWVVA